MGDNYQVALVNATISFENVLDNKQTVDSEAGDIASALLQAQISESSTVLNCDSQAITDAGNAGNVGGWTTSESNNFNLANTVYQNDSATSQLGQNNASTAVQQLQAQVSQDGTNLSNAISIANVLVSIGQYASSLLSKAYTAF